MNLRIIFVLLVWFGTLSVGYAADTSASNAAQDPLLPPVKLDGYLNGYSVQLDTDQPTSMTADTPDGLTTLKKDEPQPYLGLKFTKPLDPH